MPLPILQTRRLLLRPWRLEDREPFAALNADPRVMEHFPSTLTREQSDGWADRISTQMERSGFGLWALEVPGKTPFAGFVGLRHFTLGSKVFPELELGWRLAYDAWNQGYASEAARASATFAFATLGRRELVAVTATTNLRSQRVMERLGMRRAPEEDFLHPSVPAGHALERHVLYRLQLEDWSRGTPTLAPDASVLERARFFAEALDADDFERARPLLEERSVYAVREQTHRGPDAILASYAEATRYAATLPCAVRYESSVEAEGSRASVRFTDVLSQGERMYRHQCAQHLDFEDGRILRITHEDLPGECEKVRDFLASLAPRGG